MSKESLHEEGGLVVCLASEPEPRRQFADQLISFGFRPLATGNPQIAAALVADRQAEAFLVVMETMSMSLVQAAVNARASRPEIPIIMVFLKAGLGFYPDNLADVVLIEPSSDCLKQSLTGLARRPQSISVPV